MGNQRRKRRGIALLLVVAVVAIASVLGMVMLSGATLQNRAAANQQRRTSADYLAESGINLAMYYLQYPARAPSLNAQGYWSGTGGDITLASSIVGTVNVTVTRDSADQWTYEVISIGKAGTQADTKITRTAGAQIYVRNEFAVTRAGGFNNDLQIPPGTKFIGDVWTNKSLGIKLGSNLSSITGIGYCKTTLTGVGWLLPLLGFQTSASPGPGSPANAEVNLYKTYTDGDVLRNASVIPTATTSLTGVVGTPTKTTSSNNPAGIWYRDGAAGGTLTLNDNVTINGTLVVDGDLAIRGAGIVINPQPGYPGLIVTGNLDIAQSRKSLTVNGVCYVGKALKTTILTVPVLPSDYSTFTVNGGFLSGSTTFVPIASTHTVLTTITFDATKAKAPDLSYALRSPKGVSIVRWGLP